LCVHIAADPAREITMKRLAFALALALSGVMAAPANAAVVISSEGVEGPYSHLEYSAAADGKEFLVEVRGVPFAGMTQEAFDQALMGVLMSARPSHPAAFFTTRPTSTNFDPSYRLVMVFNPARNLAFHTQCRALDRARFEPVPTGRVRDEPRHCHGERQRRQRSGLPRHVRAALPGALPAAQPPDRRRQALRPPLSCSPVASIAERA
jgi:hypothetical protein